MMDNGLTVASLSHTTLVNNQVRSVLFNPFSIMLNSLAMVHYPLSILYCPCSLILVISGPLILYIDHFLHRIHKAVAHPCRIL